MSTVLSWFATNWQGFLVGLALSACVAGCLAYLRIRRSWHKQYETNGFTGEKPRRRASATTRDDLDGHESQTQILAYEIIKLRDVIEGLENRLRETPDTGTGPGGPPDDLFGVSQDDLEPPTYSRPKRLALWRSSTREEILVPVHYAT